MPPATEVPVFKIAAATAFACTILLISDTSDARGRLRTSSPSKPAAAMPSKPATTAPAPSRSSGVGVGLYIPLGSRPAAASSNSSPQRAVDDPANGPLQYDPTLASADAKPAAASTDDKAPAQPKELAAAPSTECVVAKHPAPVKDKETVAAQEPAKTDPARSRSAFLVPVANKHKRAAAPQAATICYVQRDGSCTPY
jgi:hypothetical protein